MEKNCPFCSVSEGRDVAENDVAFAIKDEYPISPGHILIIPKRHVASFFDLDRDEQAGILDLLSHVKSRLDSELHPHGFNVGINDGQAAGQTIFHVHVHLIPRFEGDTEDPRGGVRWIVPDKANYWGD